MEYQHPFRASSTPGNQEQTVSDAKTLASRLYHSSIETFRVPSAGDACRIPARIYAPEREALQRALDTGRDLFRNPISPDIFMRFKEVLRRLFGRTAIILHIGQRLGNQCAAGAIF